LGDDADDLVAGDAHRAWREQAVLAVVDAQVRATDAGFSALVTCRRRSRDSR
jgi:hypothetical protein